MPKRTPAELSRLKAEKEARELQEVQLARKRQEELRGPNFPRDHPQRLNGNVPGTVRVTLVYFLESTL
jgi:chromatin modification-related protein VID21